MRHKIGKLSIAVLCTVMMLICGACEPFAKDVSPIPAHAPTATGTPEMLLTATPTPTGAATPEKNGDVVILFTSDVHCGIDRGFGYAGLAQIRDYLEAQGDEVILVDNGDNIQGEPIGTMTKGQVPADLMNAMGYSVAIPGNHEFDYGMQQFLEIAENAKFTYISCNFQYKGENVFPSYVIRELAGKQVAFVGVTTPRTILDSAPAYFMEDGEYVYGFLQDATGEGVYGAVQKATDEAREEGAEFVIVMAHTGNEAECRPWTYADILANTDGIDVLLDGHSHDTDEITMTNKSGKRVVRVACGTKLEGIGWCRIAADGKITTGLYKWENEIPAPELLGLDNEMSWAVAAASEQLNYKLDEVVAYSEVDLTVNDPVAKDADGKPIRMVRRAETNLGDLVADAYRYVTDADIAFVNGGGIRANIAAGDITRRDILSVHPYGNTICVIEVTGQTILDALEWGASAVPLENGGFLQVSGLNYSIDASKDSPCVKDENGFFGGISGERRVSNVLVNGEPIDPAKKYSLAGHNFMLLSGGDGFTMFAGAPVLQNSVKIDNQALIDFFTDGLCGAVEGDYAKIIGSGRITITE